MFPSAAWKHEAQQWQQEDYPQWAAQMRVAIAQTRAMRHGLRNKYPALDREPDSPFEQLEDAMTNFGRQVERFGSEELISGPRAERSSHRDGRGHGHKPARDGGAGRGHEGGRGADHDGHGHGHGAEAGSGGYGRHGRHGGGGLEGYSGRGEDGVPLGRGGHARYGGRGHAGHGYGEETRYDAYDEYETVEYGEQEPMGHERGRRHQLRGRGCEDGEY